jgi:AAA domain
VEPGNAAVTAALDRVLTALQARGRTYRPSGGQYAAQCPAHDDRNPSLAVRNGGGKVLIKCHAGCTTEDVVAALGLATSDLFDGTEEDQRRLRPEIVATYDYCDANGAVLYQKVRYFPKDFRVRRPDGRGGWTWNIGDTERVLYRLPELLAAIREDRTIYVVEGEKDADRLASLGQIATCNFDGAAKAGQATKWRDTYSDTLRGAHVVVIADGDATGLAHARAIVTSLASKAKSIRLVRSAVDFPGADVSDHLDADHGVDELVIIERGDDSDDPPDEPRPSHNERASILALYAPIHWPDLWADTTDDGPDWLVPDVLERGRSHALVGAAKSGKSLLTLDMVCGLVTGRSLLGRPSPHTRPVRVFYIDLENAKADVRERLDAFGVGPDDLAALAYYSFPSLPALDSAAGGQHLLALAEHHDAELVVIDTVARVVVGPENDADTFRALYRHALAPLKAQGRAVLRLDHLGKDATAGARGSSAKADDVDTTWHLVDHGEGRIALRLDRQRSGHHPETVDLIRRTIDPEVALRHVRVDPVSDPRVAGLLTDLERLGVPSDAGRTQVRKALTGAGIKASNDLVRRAIETRKSDPGSFPSQPRADDHLDLIQRDPDSPDQTGETAAQSDPGSVADRADQASGVQTVDRSASTPVLVRGPGRDRPPGPGPETGTHSGARTCTACPEPLLLTRNSDGSDRTQCERCRIESTTETP